MTLGRQLTDDGAPRGWALRRLCVQEWVVQKPECPLCRAPIRPGDLVRVCHSEL